MIRRRPPSPAAAPTIAIPLGATITLSVYGMDPIRALHLVPVPSTATIAAELGAQITFEVVGIERHVVEGVTNVS